MNKNTKIIWIVVVVIIVIGGFVAFKNTSTKPESLTLGLMLPLTGDVASAGQNMRKGMELALEEYKKDYPESSIRVVVEDDAFDPKKGLSAYRKLVDIDKVDMILMISTPVIDVIHKDVVKRGIPVIQLGVQTVGVADDNIIQFSPAAEAPIGYLAKWLNDNSEFSSKKVAVLYDNGPGPLSFFNAFKANYTHDFTPMMSNGKGDLRGYATKIAGENYDAVVFIQNPLTGALATKELLTIDKTLPMLVYDAQLQTGFGEYTNVLGDTNKINGAKSMWFKEGDVDEFKNLFKKKYNEDPGFLADFAYDMINTALATYDSSDAKWVSNLKKFKDDNGVSGSIAFDDKGVRIQQMVITEVQNGKLVPTK